MKALDPNGVLRQYGETELRRQFDQSTGRRTLSDVHATFKRWFGDEYDLDTLNAVLATAAAERLTGDPLWLLVVSGPGNAKTETVQALNALDNCYVTSTIHRRERCSPHPPSVTGPRALQAAYSAGSAVMASSLSKT